MPRGNIGKCEKHLLEKSLTLAGPEDLVISMRFSSSQLLTLLFLKK